jgi:hypothetical protein
MPTKTNTTKNKKTKNKIVIENTPTQIVYNPKRKIILWIVLILLSSILMVLGFTLLNIQNEKKLATKDQEIQQVRDLARKNAKEKDEEALKNLKSIEENIALKESASKKAAEEAAATLKKQQEEEIASKKYVIADKKETNLPGLNTRENACGNLSGETRVWGTGGEVLEGPTNPGACLGGEWDWYKVRWNDGVVGWSIADYLTFSSQTQISQTGFITGYSPVGWDGEKTTFPKICAVNQVDKITYCNAQIDKDQYNYKLVVPAGDYIMTGSIKSKDFHTGILAEQKILYSVIVQCGYTQECYEKHGQEGYNKSAIVKVQAGGVATKIDLGQVFPIQ